jgi:hypothetical protein
MVSTFTTNKALEKPGNGDYVDTWNVPVNADLDVIDQALGTVTSINVGGGNVTLADTQYRSMALTFTGALSAARTVTVPSGVGGSWIVTNNTTDASGGPWSVTFASAGGGTSVALVRNKSSIVYSDGTNITEVNINAAIGAGSVTSVDVSGGTTGLTTSGGPVTTSGTITISGTLIPSNGGTGITSYTVGDILYASASNTLASLANVATGNVLLSGGIAGAPAYGKVGLTTHVTGTLPVANGGTGVTSSTGTGSVVLATSPVLTTPNLGTPSALTLTNATGLPIVAGTTGTLTVARGGNGLTATPTNGQIDIGNGTGFTRATLTAGAGISVTNGAGSISIAATTGIALDRQVFDSSGTWTKPSNGTICIVQIWGAGGGAGNTNNTVGGGGGGGYSCVAFPLSNLSAVGTVSVTMGAGGTGGSSNPGAGGSTTFGAFITHAGGAAGRTVSVGCSAFPVTGESGRLSATSGIDVIFASQEDSKSTVMTEANTNGGYYRSAANMIAPGNGSTDAAAQGISALGGAGGIRGTSGLNGVAPGGGGGQNSSNGTGGSGAIGRMIITVI